MAGFGFDAGAIAAEGKKGDMYLVVQVVLTEKFIGTESEYQALQICSVLSMNKLQRDIDYIQYQLHHLAQKGS